MTRLSGILRRSAPMLKTSPTHGAAPHVDLKPIVARKMQDTKLVIKEFRRRHGKDKVCEVSVDMMYSGMRGICGTVCETSMLDANAGITFREHTLTEALKFIPTADGGEEALPEGMFWLLMTGEYPSKEQVRWVSHEWASRAKLPDHTLEFLDSVPYGVHPMTQLSSAVTMSNVSSKFFRAYKNGVRKSSLWEYAYEDAMDVIGKMPLIAGKIYCNTYNKTHKFPKMDVSKDWSHNYASMLGHAHPGFTDLLRLYLTIHADHEGANVSAHAVNLVGSALSDPYLALAAGFNGLAGPLHGLANQEVLIFLLRLQKEIGDDPSDEAVEEYCRKLVSSGNVIPGYGHAVLRVTDPRFICQKNFALRHLPTDSLFRLVLKLSEIVPPILKATGKVQNPWPNVDAHSGVLLYHYGLREMEYYTVLFAVSRTIGTMSQYVWNRGLGVPIERPKSLSTQFLLKKFKFTPSVVN